MLPRELLIDRETSDCRVSTSFPGLTGTTGFGTVAQEERKRKRTAVTIRHLAALNVFSNGIVAPIRVFDLSGKCIIAQPYRSAPPREKPWNGGAFSYEILISA
jgi:hypothetical protein